MKCCLGIVEDGVDGVEAQAVEVVFLEPVQRVLDEEVAHDAAALLAVEVDAGAPGRLVTLGEERLGVGVEVVPGRAEVVVDHVEEHHQAERVRPVDEALQVVGPAVGRIRARRAGRRRSPSSGCP